MDCANCFFKAATWLDLRGAWFCLGPSDADSRFRTSVTLGLNQKPDLDMCDGGIISDAIVAGI